MEIIYFQGSYINILGSRDYPYFIGPEIGRILEFIQPHYAIWTHVWKAHKISDSDLFEGFVCNNTLKMQPNSIVLSEQGLYQLIFACKLDTARTFQKFIVNNLPF